MCVGFDIFYVVTRRVSVTGDVCFIFYQCVMYASLRNEVDFPEACNLSP